MVPNEEGSNEPPSRTDDSTLLVYSSCKPHHINLYHVNPIPTRSVLTTRGDVDRPQTKTRFEGGKGKGRYPDTCYTRTQKTYVPIMPLECPLS